MITVANLISRGILKVGDGLIWYRRSTRVTYNAKIQADGTIITSDGKVHKTLSGAAKHFSQKPIDGWNVWKLEGNGASLAELRKRIEE